MVIRLGPPVLESLTRISKFYGPSDSEHKSHTMTIKNWLSIDFELGTPWLRTYSHNYYTMLWWVFNFYISILKVLKQFWRSFTSLNCASALKIHTQHPEQHQIPAKTNQHLLNHLQTNTPLTLNYATPSLLCSCEGNEQQEQKLELIY